MNAYMIITNKIIKPFNEHPRDCLITNQKLGRLQEEALQGCGLELKPFANSKQKAVTFPIDNCFAVDRLKEAEKNLVIGGSLV